MLQSEVAIRVLYPLRIDFVKADNRVAFNEASVTAGFFLLLIQPRTSPAGHLSLVSVPPD